MTKDSHPQRQITRGFKNTSYPASKKKNKTYIYQKALLSLATAIVADVQLYATQGIAISFTSE